MSFAEATLCFLDLCVANITMDLVQIRQQKRKQKSPERLSSLNCNYE